MNNLDRMDERLRHHSSHQWILWWIYFIQSCITKRAHVNVAPREEGSLYLGFSKGFNPNNTFCMHTLCQIQAFHKGWCWMLYMWSLRDLPIAASISLSQPKVMCLRLMGNYEVCDCDSHDRLAPGARVYLIVMETKQAILLHIHFTL